LNHRFGVSSANIEQIQLTFENLEITRRTELSAAEPEPALKGVSAPRSDWGHERTRRSIT
jgi:hypothetical protein